MQDKRYFQRNGELNTENLLFSIKSSPNFQVFGIYKRLRNQYNNGYYSSDLEFFNAIRYWLIRKNLVIGEPGMSLRDSNWLRVKPT